MKTVQYRWFDIGIQLGIPHYKLKEFEKEDNSFAATIDYWLNGNIPDAFVTWEYLVAVLKSLEEFTLAEAICSNQLDEQSDTKKEGKTAS